MVGPKSGGRTLCTVWSGRSILFAGALLACTFACSTAGQAVDEPAVTVSLPEDICAEAWEHMPAALRVKKVGLKGIYFSPKKLFELKCNEYKDELIEQVKAPFEAAKKDAEQQLKQPFDDLKQGFDAYLAEKAREKILPTLPKEEQERFQNDSAFMQEKVHEWLQDPNQETAEYVRAYIQSRYSRLYKAYEAFVDLTNGQSKEIVDGLNDILEKAQGRLKSVLGLVREAEADPETPWTDKAKEYGLSGYWVDRFKEHEGEIREINDRTKVIDAAQIVVGAFQTDDSVAKIAALFDVMETLAGAASDSNVPIASLFGDIVAAYAKVAKETLAAVNALGDKLKARAGYCFGPGVPLGSQSSDRYREAEIAAREIPDTLLCPLGIGVTPWKDIYQQVEPGPEDQLHFWADGTFIRGAAAGGGRYGAQESLKLMRSAREIGYAVPELVAGDTRPIADVYNVPFSGASGNGIPGLMAEARSVIEEIDNKIARLTSAPAYTGQCAADAVLKHIERQAGLNLAAFRDERNRYGVDRLVATYAASYAAGHGGFGEAGGARAGAYDTYQNIRDGLKNVSIVVVHGSVRDTNRGYGVPCPDCGGAPVSVSVTGGEQVAGCEVTKTDATGDFVVVAVRTSPAMSIALGADVNGVKSETVTVDGAYLANGSLDTSGVFLSTTAFLPVDLAAPAQAAETPPSEQPPPSPGDNLPDADTEATKAKEAAEQAVRCNAERTKLATARMHIDAGSFNDAERILADVNPALCPAIAPELANTKARVASAAAGLAGDAEGAQRSCEPTRWSETARKLRKVENARLASLAGTLETMAAAYDSAQSDLASARTLYSEGKFDQAAQRLEEALGRLGALPRQGQCKAVITEIEDALDKARKVATGLTKVDEAIAACDVNRLQSHISQLGAVKQPHQLMTAKKSEASSLVDALSAAQKQLQSVLALKGAGKLDEAKTRIAELTASLKRQGLTRCKIYAEASSEAEEINGSSEAAQLAEAAVADCDLAAIDGLLAGLASSAKGNDKRTAASLKKGREACQERKRKEDLANATEACRGKHGQGAYATERKSGEFFCECQKPYIFDEQVQRCRTNEEIIAEGTELCRQTYGDQAYALKQKSDGSFDCSCAKGFEFDASGKQCERRKTKAEIIAEGTEVCRSEFGAAAFAKRRNADGTFECFCERGFDMNATKRTCERHKSKQEILAEGTERCRNELGPGFYAQRQLPNGEFHCVCQAGLYFDEASKSCIQPTVEDGHQVCKSNYGAESYLIGINNDGTYNCYIPQQQAPVAGGQCPKGEWINPKTGRCISWKELTDPLIPLLDDLGEIGKPR
jgi:hypothetical protein